MPLLQRKTLTLGLAALLVWFGYSTWQIRAQRGETAIQVNDMEELADVLVALRFVNPLPRGRGVAVVGTGGGATVLAGDEMEKAGLHLPQLSPEVEAELRQLYEGGLKLLYVGIETGDDELLDFINKGETSHSIVEAINKAKSVGMKVSVMIISGLGGKQYSRQHALGSAAIVNAVQPQFLSLLVLSAPYGEEVYRQKFKGTYIPMSAKEQIEEMRLFIEHTELDASIFRSNHVSNYVNLEGVLGKDKDVLLKNIDMALKNGWFADHPRTML